MLDNSQISQILAISLQAGSIAKDFFFNKDYVVSKKNDDSDVSSADIAVSDFIYKNLSRLFPEIPIICEERADKKSSSQLFFLIDPIDGTSGFINGKEEFAVNIALIENQKPIFGAIYAPIFNGGKLIYNDNNEIYIYNNLLQNLDYVENYHKFLEETQPCIIKSQNINNHSKVRIITSRRASDSAINSFLAQKFATKIPNYDLLKLSSSIKFFFLAEQGYDFYIHLNQTMEWDTAAGQAIVEKLGYKVKKIELNDIGFIFNNELLYNKEFFVNPSFLIYK